MVTKSDIQLDKDAPRRSQVGGTSVIGPASTLAWELAPLSMSCCSLVWTRPRVSYLHHINALDTAGERACICLRLLALHAYFPCSTASHYCTINSARHDELTILSCLHRLQRYTQHIPPREPNAFAPIAVPTVHLIPPRPRPPQSIQHHVEQIHGQERQRFVRPKR
jgi:hypothetical protein